MIIILLGPPGSGKGTQSSIIVGALKAVHISTGDILRKEINNNTDFGQEIKKIIGSGKLISNDLVNKVIIKELSCLDLNMVNVVLDGYPRNVEQAKFLDNLYDVSKVIYLNLSDDEIKKRLLGRFSCPKCNRTYNLYFDRPLKEQECNDCGPVEFMKRQDDNEYVIENRLAEYRKETKPLIQYYTRKMVLEEIDARLSKEEVNGLILNSIKQA